MRLGTPRIVVLVGILALLSGAYYIGEEMGGRAAIARNDVNALVLEFLGSTDANVRGKAVRSMKDIYNTASSSPREQARALNALIGMIHSAHEPYIFDIVFMGEPFERFLDPTSAEGSITNLTGYSLSLHPTSYAAQQLAFENSIEARILAKKERSPREDAELARHVAIIRDQIDMAEQLLPHDLASAGSPAEMANILIIYFQWQGHLFGDIAHSDPEYLPLALQNIRAALALTESFSHTLPELAPLLLEKQAGLHWGYVRYVSGIPGARTAHPEVAEHARILIELLEKHPDKMSNFYILFAAVREERHTEAEEHGAASTLHAELIEDQGHIVQELQNLLPEANTFFERHGVTAR